jgi:hypothetical protein
MQLCPSFYCPQNSKDGLTKAGKLPARFPDLPRSPIPLISNFDVIFHVVPIVACPNPFNRSRVTRLRESQMKENGGDLMKETVIS